jgi:5'-3' exonuclease
MIPGWNLNPVTGVYKYITLTEANQFFYTQLLTGDRVDNIPGLKGIGPKKAAKLLDGLTEEKNLYNACRAQYTGVHGFDGDKFLEENAHLLYIQRKEGVLWTKPS